MSIKLFEIGNYEFRIERKWLLRWKILGIILNFLFETYLTIMALYYILNAIYHYNAMTAELSLLWGLTFFAFIIFKNQKMK